MNKKELQAIAQAAGKNIKNEDDLNQFRQMRIRIKGTDYSTLSRHNSLR